MGPSSGQTPVYKQSHYPSQMDTEILCSSEHFIIVKMPGVATTRFNELEFPNQPIASLSDMDMVFGFLEDGDAIPGTFSGVSSPESEDSYAEEDHENENDSVEDDRKFWETQHQNLHSTLCRTSSLESKIRNATKEALNEIQMSGNVCACGKPEAIGACRSCLMREVSGRLRNAGYNSAICKSKWRSSPYIPSGKHGRSLRIP